jgi:hypothetical protein
VASSHIEAKLAAQWLALCDALRVLRNPVSPLGRQRLRQVTSAELLEDRVAQARQLILAVQAQWRGWLDDVDTLFCAVTGSQSARQLENPGACAAAVSSPAPHFRPILENAAYKSTSVLKVMSGLRCIYARGGGRQCTHQYRSTVTTN